MEVTDAAVKLLLLLVIVVCFVVLVHQADRLDYRTAFWAWVLGPLLVAAFTKQKEDVTA